MQHLNLIPYPAAVHRRDGAFVLRPETPIRYDAPQKAPTPQPSC